MSIIIAVLVVTGAIVLVVKGLRWAGRSAYKGVTGNDPEANERRSPREPTEHQRELARLTAERRARRGR